MTEQTPLAAEIRARIEHDGPMGIDTYMGLCLGHPQHGYYMSRDPFGRGGDFITAPEVSQMFGEAIGVWLATAWQMMGLPKNVRLVELGPGRGTLMADMLRAMKVLPALREAVDVHFVEISPALRAAQEKTMKEQGVRAHWHEQLDDVPDGPAMIVANEFFDAIPVRQLVLADDGWHERVVVIDENGALAFGIGKREKAPDWAAGAEPEAGSIVEISPQRAAIARAVGARLAGAGGVGLIVDYGHALSFAGETLQAVYRHKFTDVLSMPGQVDITSHVDFQELAKAFEEGGAKTHGPRTQRAFLYAMGIREREKALKKNAPARARIMLSRQAERLVSETQMGNLFKVLAVTHASLGIPHPFGEPQ